jgi:excisionase family DNA binding protein
VDRKAKGNSNLIAELKARKTALKATEVAKLLNISSTQAYRLAEQGRVPCFRVGTALRFDPGHLAAWLKKKL